MRQIARSELGKYAHLRPANRDREARVMKVRVGYGLGNLRPLDGERLGALAEGIEQHGFDSLWLSERISGPAPDPVLGLTWAAARTQQDQARHERVGAPGPQPGARREGVGDARRALGRSRAPGVRPRHRASGRAAGVRRRPRRSRVDLRRGAAAAAPALERGRRRPRRHVVPLRGHERAAEAGAPARRVARRQGAVRAATRRPARRRVARVVRDARAVRGGRAR